MSRAGWFGIGLAAFAASLAGCASRSSSLSHNSATADKTTVAVSVQKGFTIRWVKQKTDPGEMSVDIEGLGGDTLQALRSASPDQPQWIQIVAVYVDPPVAVIGQKMPAVQGRYEVLADRIRFVPQFPVQPGRAFRVEVRSSNLPNFTSPNPQPTVARFQIPVAKMLPKTMVRHVYPSTSTLPENVLKFYIHFSGPMSRGGIYEHIHLLNASGKPVELPFLEINEELWNPELTRLTLFIDPGRIKRGVRPLEEIGPSVEAGKRYTLVIDRQWQDGDGIVLKKSYKKKFTVTPPDRDPPDPARWSIKSPRANTREPMVIRFPEPMDHALSQRLIWVIDADRQRLAGRIVLSNEEKQWSFTPDSNWKAGPHKIVASTLLEDLAGNSLGRPFEVDVFEQIQKEVSDPTIALPFDVFE